MIRTKIVELSTIEAAAYRRKLRGGKSGLVVMRYDADQPGLATISKTTGEPEPAANASSELFPSEAFREALELTNGLPYTRRGPVKLTGLSEEPAELEETAEELATIDSAEYAAVVEAYTNRKGELSYDLINKDCIQFAKSSKVVADMVAENAPVEDIRNHVAKVKFEALTGNRSLTIAQVKLIIEMLDEVSPKHVLKEFNDEIRKMLARR